MRPGSRWLASVLAGSDIDVTFDADGSLIDVECAEDVPAHELTAWSDDVKSLLGGCP